jgi:hypothetical protein
LKVRLLIAEAVFLLVPGIDFQAFSRRIVSGLTHQKTASGFAASSATSLPSTGVRFLTRMCLYALEKSAKIFDA